MKTILTAVFCAVLAGGCTNINPVDPPSSSWSVISTDQKVVATQGNWMVIGEGGSPNYAYDPGVWIFYKNERIGGGAVHWWIDSSWNDASVPLFQPQRAKYSVFRSWVADGPQISFHFQDSVGAMPDDRYVDKLTGPTKMDVALSVKNDVLYAKVSGFFYIFPAIDDSVTVSCVSEGMDTSYVFSQSSPGWEKEFFGPLSFCYQDPHFILTAATADAPLVQLQSWADPNKEFMEIDGGDAMDASLYGRKPSDDIHMDATITSKF